MPAYAVTARALGRCVARRVACLASLVALAALTGAGAAPALAQQEGKKGQEGAVALLLLPVAILVSVSLQVATLAVFPRFARRCGTAVGRYRWQTPLVGLAAFLGVFLLTAVVGGVAHNQQAGSVPLVLASLLSMIGCVGVSLHAGRWAMARVGAEGPVHPVVEVLAGGCVLGWAMVLVPCAGQLLWLFVACASMGAFLAAVFAGARLDEAPRRERRITAAEPSPPPAPPLAPDAVGPVHQEPAPSPPPSREEDRPQADDSQAF